MKLFKNLSLATLLAALSLSPVLAADESRESRSFSGRVSAFDKSEQTVKVDGETYQLLPTSRVTKSDARAEKNDLAVGQRVEGRYKESAEGKREVLSLDITRGSDRATGGDRDRATRESGATFRGKVGKVDRSAQTIRVDGKTYHILPTTVMNKPAGGTTAFSDLKEDQHVSGTYKESSSGKRELLTLDVGRKSNDR
jgi:hypothetical protein